MEVSLEQKVMHAPRLILVRSMLCLKKAVARKQCHPPGLFEQALQANDIIIVAVQPPWFRYAQIRLLCYSTGGELNGY